MRRPAIYLLTLTAAATISAGVGTSAQKIAIGERAPEINAAEWLTAKPASDKPRLIDFYHSASREAGSLLPSMDGFAKRYGERIAVIVIAREPKEKVRPALMKDSPAYYVAIDEDGRTFAAYGVNVVPFGVLVDAKGKVLWLGNPAQLDADMLDKLLK